MHDLALLKELVIVFGAAVATVLVLGRLRLPTLAGFIIAGAIIGPSGLGLVRGIHEIELLAEVGVVLLLFTIGLEFPFANLRRIGRLVALGGGLQVGLTVAAVTGLALAAGEALPKGVFFGFLVALSSTAIVLRALAERGEVDAPHGRMIVGALIFQDLCVIPMMLVTPMLAGDGGGPWAIPLALGKAAVVVVVAFVLARLVAPRALKLVAATKRRDLFVLSVLLICVGIAWATSAAGLSLALGAFLAGIVLAESEYAHQALADVLPLTDTLSSLFFISVGMLLDASIFVERPLSVFGLVLALLLGKTAIATFAALAMRFPVRVAVLAGFALAQIGEFSFVLARVGDEAGLIQGDETRMFVAASVLTMIATPFAVRMSPHLAAGATRLRRLERLLGVKEAEGVSSVAPSLADHVVVMGYGVGGQLLAQALQAAGTPYLVLDLDAARVRAARERDILAYFGDATSGEILNHVRVAHARRVAILLNDPDSTRRAVAAIRRAAPDVPILVRARYLAEIGELERLGATDVVAQEFEASVEVITRVLRKDAGARPVGDGGSGAAHPAEHRAGGGRPAARGRRQPAPVVGFHDFLAHESDWIAGRTIAESRLRTRTGATIVAISHQGETAIDPSPDEAVAEGDVLYVVGNAAQVERAFAVLRVGSDGPGATA